MKRALSIFRSIISLLLISGLMTFNPCTTAYAEGQIINADVESGIPGTIVHLTGTSFTPSLLPAMGTNGTVMSYADIYFPDKTTLVKSAVINTWGNLDTEILIKDMPAGDYTIWIHDRSGGANAWVSRPFTVLPDAMLSSSSGYVKDSISISGKGFNADSWIQVYFNNEQVMLSPTDQYGNFAIDEFTIPEDCRITNSVRIRDSVDNEIKLSFTAQHQKVTVHPNTTPPEKEILIEGSGFRSTAKVMFSMYSTQNSFNYLDSNYGVITTDEEGEFSGYIIIPICPAGDYIIEAFDGRSRSGVSLTISALGAFNRSIGFVGTSVTFNGTGFPANRFTILSFDDTPLTEAMSDSSGTVNATFVIPPCVPGNHIISITDGNITQLYNFSVLSKAKLEMNRVYASPGTTIYLEGTGFLPGKIAFVSWDGEPVMEKIIDKDEGFSANLTVPVCSGGTHIISASDGMNDITRTIDIEVKEAVVFIPPQLVTPDLYTISGTDVILVWTDPNGLDGVQYKLQVAEDITFIPETIITEETDLAANEYLFVYSANISADTAGLPFYWRVKAVDTVDNTESSWSEAQTFIIRNPAFQEAGGDNPSIFNYSVFAEIGALGFLVVFWMIRKKRHQVQVQQV